MHAYAYTRIDIMHYNNALVGSYKIIFNLMPRVSLNGLK